MKWEKVANIINDTMCERKLDGNDIEKVNVF